MHWLIKASALKLELHVVYPYISQASCEHKEPYRSLPPQGHPLVKKGPTTCLIINMSGNWVSGEEVSKNKELQESQYTEQFHIRIYVYSYTHIYICTH